ncbi:lipid-A-disaccharide synthase [Crocosphaera sp. UHCC 0190]|uniref:lipid-A-disaccharide synthase n=1 Tax=Crocosphaera sp. UHCC 0190 TaxID=3110246 RepID=UPI002B1FC38A|nr:lipid-A-disaccharide synthase [Crocosphaera sp. UHCC 0190]MEA5509076.1 lipid-A-disaccharide synthase [Crocosphaera sp. UHCC 0190]
MKPVDILILANGPGEITTWVRPVVKSLRELLGDDRSLVRISVMLSPCPHGTGQEAAIARRYPEVDRVQSSENFFPFLLWGKTADNWDWREQGVVLFLGGDQFYPLILGKRLGYRTVIYAEWEARWYRWIDHFGVMNQSVKSPIPQPYHDKLTIVGDLMADVAPTNSDFQALSTAPVIGLLPGSKSGKLTQGVPLCLAIAEHIYEQKPQTRFLLPVAPTIDLSTLARFADPQQNPFVMKLGGVSAKLMIPPDDSHQYPYLETAKGLQIDLITQFPAHDYLRQCCLALTTVGANTAELGALGLPMIVLLPTQQLDAMRTWDGIPGVLANLPIIGSNLAKLINARIVKQGRLFAWPNIWAKEEIVPELVGELEADKIGQLVLNWLEHPAKLNQIRDRLLQVRGKAGAANKIAIIVQEQLNFRRNY